MKQVPLWLPDANKKLYETAGSFSKNKMHLINGFTKYEYFIHMHAQEFFEMNIILGGKGVHYYAEHRFAVSPGDVFVISPLMPHGYYNLSHLEVFHILVHPAFFNYYREDLDMLENIHLLFHLEPQIRSKMGMPLFHHLDTQNLTTVRYKLREIQHLSQQNPKTPAVYLLTNYAMLRFLIALSTMISDTDESTESVKLLHVLDFIQKHCDEKLNVDDLAEKSSLSRSRFYTLFRQYTGMSPAAYIDHCRLIHAESLLLNSSLSITDIAMQCGYYDSAHFAKNFRKYTGMSPHVYRKRIDECSEK